MLPPGLAARLDLGRLAPVSASFVDEALKWRYSDLLFTAPLDEAWPTSRVAAVSAGS